MGAPDASDGCMLVDLTEQEARFLAQHLAMHIAHVDAELIHTDKRAMQRELAEDERKLNRVLAKIEAALQTDST